MLLSQRLWDIFFLWGPDGGLTLVPTHNTLAGNLSLLVLTVVSGARLKHPSGSWFPSDHARQVDAYYFLAQIGAPVGRPVDFLDLGTGVGSSFVKASIRFPELSWIGVDIADSGPVRKRRRTDIKFATYDGIHIPAEDSSMDIVFSRQVFEHVRYPEALMQDVHRVLRPGGSFIGSVSQLEPYHAQSYWNFTYYGFATLAIESGMRVVEFRPGVDALTLIVRNLLKFQFKMPVTAFEPLVRGLSPLNALYNQILAGRDIAAQNRHKVHAAGHLCFWCERPSAGDGTADGDQQPGRLTP